MTSAAGQGALPGFTFTDQCIARVRVLYTRQFAQKKNVTLQAAMWDAVLDDRGRRFLCHIAKLPPVLAERTAAELTAGELFALFDGFQRVNEWTHKLERALERVRAELPT